jgi:hypothetical protein
MIDTVLKGIRRMGDRTFDFEEQLEMGVSAEADIIESLSGSLNVEAYDYNDDPEKQRSGIDLTVEGVDIDIKTQSEKYISTGNIPIEILSVKEKSKPGWFYKSEADFVLWLYECSGEFNYHYTAYLMRLDQELIEWFVLEHEKWTNGSIEVRNNGRYGRYTAVNHLIPIPAFPPEKLIQLNPRTL